MNNLDDVTTGLQADPVSLVCRIRKLEEENDNLKDALGEVMGQELTAWLTAKPFTLIRYPDLPSDHVFWDGIHTFDNIDRVYESHDGWRHIRLLNKSLVEVLQAASKNE